MPFIKAKNQVRLSLDELAEVLGIEVRDGNEMPPLSVEGELVFEPVSIKLDAALDEAQKRRPILQSLENSLTASAAAIDYAKGDYLPSLSVKGSYDIQMSPFSNRVSDELHGWTVGANASWNLFDGFATSGRVTEAKGAHHSQAIALGKQRLAVNVEVRRSYSTLIEAQELVVASKKVIEQAQESLRLASERLNAGASPQIEVLDSQVALTQAKTNEVQALYDYDVAQAALNRAIGALFTSDKNLTSDRNLTSDKNHFR